MKKAILFLAAAVALTTPALAKEKPLDSAPLDKKVCRFEAPTGTIMRKRVCHTAAEWQQIDASHQADARQMVGRGNTIGSPGGLGQ